MEHKNLASSPPLLTIAIPTYNRAKLLDICLSKLAHEFGNNSEVELIISNNASIDDTTLIVNRHKQINFPNLLYIENSTNLGPDQNIAQCFREATGKYVWIFSDDDLLLPGYGNSLLMLLSSNNWGMIHLKSIWYNSGANPNPEYETFQYEQYEDALTFIHQIHYWVTFITGSIINKSTLLEYKLTYSFNGTNLVQLGWVFPAIFAGRPNIIVKAPVLACLANNTGGYKLFQTFATSFNIIMIRLIVENIIPVEVRHIINKKLITNFFPPFITSNIKPFNKESILHTLYKEFREYSDFWTKLMPIYATSLMYALINKPKSFLKFWSAKIVFRVMETSEFKQLTHADNILIQAKFQKFGFNSELPKKFIVYNPQYISIGKNFRSLYNLRLEAWDEYAGQKFFPNLIIGDNVIMNTDCHIGCINKVKIGNNVLLASRVYISDHSHGSIELKELLLTPANRNLYSKGPVIIEDNVWIGEGVCIMPGVTIGENSIIGANAVVTKDIPPNVVAAGVPAIVIKKIV